MRSLERLFIIADVFHFVNPFLKIFLSFFKKIFLPKFRCLRNLGRAFSLCVLLLLKGRTVGASHLGGVLFVSDHTNAVQSAVVLILAMMLALLYGAFNAGVGGILLTGHTSVFH